MVGFLFYFRLIRQNTEYSLNLPFGWECNNTPSLKSIKRLANQMILIKLNQKLNLISLKKNF